MRGRLGERGRRWVFFSIPVMAPDRSRGASDVRGLLLDVDWLEAKLSHTDIADVFNDYRRFANDRNTQLIGEAFWLSANAIVRDSSALLPQLLGRLEGELPSEITAGWRARDRSRTWLCPLAASLTRPGGPLVQTLTRRQPLYATLSLSDDGDVVALGGPEQVEVIQLSQRETVGIFRAEAATLTADGRSVVVGLSDSVTIIDIATKATIFAATCSNWPIVDVAITPDGRWVAATAGHWMMGALPGARNIDSVHVWDVDRGGEKSICNAWRYPTISTHCRRTARRAGPPRRYARGVVHRDCHVRCPVGVFGDRRAGTRQHLRG